MKKETKEGLETLDVKIPELKQSEKDTSLESAFSDFEKGTSEFIIENENKVQNSESKGTEIPPDKINESFNPNVELANNLKIKMFLGFFCFMISGANLFLFNLLSKTKVETADMKLNEEEKVELAIYLNNPEVLELINKLPVWVWGVVHIEMLMYTKFEIGVVRVKKENELKAKEVKAEKEVTNE